MASTAAPPADDMARLSLSSRTVHADDGIAAHRAVAPAMHVSTTFRYSDDPGQLSPWNNFDVSPCSQGNSLLTDSPHAPGFQSLGVWYRREVRGLMLAPVAVGPVRLSRLLA